MKKLTALVCALLLLCASALAEEPLQETVIPPQWPVPDYVTWLLDVARGELGYTEGYKGYTKYGEWVGDPRTQWCAEYLCWCVDQVDKQQGTNLLRNVFPMYSGTNTGRDWYIEKGRYIVRWGNLEDWGYQWLVGEDHYLSTGDYIPQPGDWVFFTWDSDTDTDHVALVEYCTVDEQGNIRIHVLEGNAPDKVQRNAYDLTYTRILGYGTVHKAANTTMRGNNRGDSVLALQEKLVYLGYLEPHRADGYYGGGTTEAVKRFQEDHGLKVLGIANIATQTAIDLAMEQAIDEDPATWTVIDE